MATNGTPKIKECIYEVSSEQSRLDPIFIKTKGIKKLKDILTKKFWVRMRKKS
jgi:hypothetical protein